MKDRVWECEVCRAHEWERARRCGFIRKELHTIKRAVWSRNGVESDTCPRTTITVQSIQWLQMFRAWKLSGRRVHEDMPVAVVEAYGVLAELERKLKEDGLRADSRTTTEW